MTPGTDSTSSMDSRQAFVSTCMPQGSAVANTATTVAASSWGKYRKPCCFLCWYQHRSFQHLDSQACFFGHATLLDGNCIMHRVHTRGPATAPDTRLVT